MEEDIEVNDEDLILTENLDGLWIQRGANVYFRLIGACRKEIETKRLVDDKRRKEVRSGVTDVQE